MVVLDEQRQSLTAEAVAETNDDSSLREERRRTGRYAAAGTAIFLSLLGLYEAVTRGTPEYAALFLPAVIMCVYVLWILHASRRSLRRQAAALQIIENNLNALKKVTVVPETETVKNEVPPPEQPLIEINEKSEKSNRTFCRTYSVA